MKKVLIITYLFPPVGGAGVQRTLKWTKYLPEFGWEPYVLTARNPSVPVYDKSLEAEMGKNLRIFRTRTLEIPYRLKRAAWNRAEELEIGSHAVLRPGGPAPGFRVRRQDRPPVGRRHRASAADAGRA